MPEIDFDDLLVCLRSAVWIAERAAHDEVWSKLHSALRSVEDARDAYRKAQASSTDSPPSATGGY